MVALVWFVSFLFSMFSPSLCLSFYLKGSEMKCLSEDVGHAELVSGGFSSNPPGNNELMVRVCACNT